MRNRTSPIPLALAFLLALLIHSAALLLGTRAFTTAHHLPPALPDTTETQAALADRRRESPSPLEPDPPPTPEPQADTDPREIALGSDRPHEEAPLTVAWLPYDDFRKLIAPQSTTIQPAQQPLADPTPAAPVELFPESSSPLTPNPPSEPTAAPPEPDTPPPTPSHPTTHQQPALSDLPSASPPPAAQDANPPPPVQQQLAPIPAVESTPTIATPAPTFSENPLAETDHPSPPTNPTATPDELLAFAPSEPSPTDVAAHRELADPSSPSPPSTDDTRSPQPQPAPAPSDPAPAAPTPQPAPASSQPTTPTSAPRSDSQSPPTSLERSTQPIQPGGVLTGPGIEIKTVTPQFSIITRVSAAPRNPLALIVFDPHTGRVTKAQLLESTGYSNVDAPIEASLYKWHATGSRLAQLQQPLEIRVRLILTDD